MLKTDSFHKTGYELIIVSYQYENLNKLLEMNSNKLRIQVWCNMKKFMYITWYIPVV